MHQQPDQHHKYEGDQRAEGGIEREAMRTANREGAKARAEAAFADAQHQHGGNGDGIEKGISDQREAHGLSFGLPKDRP